MTTLHEPLLGGTLMQRQIEIENDSVEEGIRRYNRLVDEAIARGDGADLKPAERLLRHWFPVMCAAVADLQSSAGKGEPGIGASIWGPVILVLDKKKIAAITMDTVVSTLMLEYEGMSHVKLSYTVGSAIIAEIHADMLREMKVDRVNDRGETNQHSAWRTLDTRFKRLNPRRINGWAKKTLAEPIWNRRVCLHAGSMLLNVLMSRASCADYDKAFAPAFQHFTNKPHKSSKRHQRWVRFSDEAERLIGDGHLMRQHLRPVYLPMLVQPYPWAKGQAGGYTQLRHSLVINSTKRQRELIEAGDMGTVYAGINALNGVGWKRENTVVGLAALMWAEGGCEKLCVPKRDDHELPPRMPDGSSKDDIATRRTERGLVKKANIRLRGDRCMFNGILGVAQRFADDTIYFPNRMDYRGRCYPVPQHLNHQGADLQRGMLRFARPVPVTSDGMRALMIHAANCFGHDKLPLLEREKWSIQNIDDIIRCATDPWVNEWWHEAEKPWQFLAACRGVAFPKTEGATLPVQSDASSNGLQHYAAITRNADLAGRVGLIDCDRPNDVYSEVAKAVAARVDQDARAGIAEAIDAKPHINRKLVKQTVMTFVYGVTASGAKTQILNRLMESGVSRAEALRLAFYLKGVVFGCVSGEFPAAAELMDWFRHCASLIANENRAVEWVSPIGFPVSQPYRRGKASIVHMACGTMRAAMDNDDMPVRVGKQKAGSAPNIIHSIDSSHMMLTAIACAEMDIDFQAVHDSYWSHAENHARMIEVTLDKFVEVHREPLAAKFHEQWSTQHPDIEFPEPPEPGDFDIERVRSAVYAFS